MAFVLPFPSILHILNIHHKHIPITFQKPTQHSNCPKNLFQTLLLGAAAAATIGNAHSASAYGLVDGRLEKCRGDVPCISTSSVGNPSKFGPPWSFQPQTNDPGTAWASLKQAVLTSRDGGKIVEESEGPEMYYLHAEFPSAFRGVDDVEFRLIKNDALVTYRSASREAIFVYPLQTPINTNKNRNRLLDIRRALGWEEFSGFNIFGLGSDVQ